jgi:hypothetical protein
MTPNWRRVSRIFLTSARRAWEPVGKCLALREKLSGAEQGATCITF